MAKPDAAVRDWLARIATAADEAPGVRGRDLRYVLTRPGGTPEAPGWAVALYEARGPGDCVEVAFDEPPSGLADDRDDPILALLAGRPGDGSPIPLTGRLGALALQQMLASGRLHLQGDPGRALRRGAPLATALRWVRGGDGRYRVASERHPPAELLPVMPPWYLDAASGTCGPLASGLPDALAATLIAAPALTARAARIVRERLAALPVALPLPGEVEDIDLGIVTPIPCLTLATQHGPSAPARDLAWLALDYAGLMTAPDPAQQTSLTRRGADRTIRLYRDREAELRIWSQLAGLRLEPLVRETTRIGFQAHDAAAWRRLIQHDLPALYRGGWRIRIEPDCRLRDLADEDRDGEHRRSTALDGAQRTLYETLRTTALGRIRAALDEADASGALRLLRETVLRLRQVCNEPRLLRLAAARGISRSVKLDLLMTLLPPILAEGRRVLIVADPPALRRLIEARLAEQGITARQPRAGAPASTRDTVELAGTPRGRSRRARTGADTLIRYAPWHGPNTEDWGGRGPEEGPARLYDLVTEGTIEERFPAWQARYPAIAEALMAGDRTNERLAVRDLELAVAALLQPPN
ncbi:DEAD/DEAH box helicase [Thiococcus pfennigii]|uniref:DEAD/DEAH box helicase n=1 Tax=Thiococcus pfennigii TaxID=1057 RepID=UPI00190703C6|nr:DEAD/DEAH box helicase [Thiococcus pfennigii]MBK1700879.1 hypothetical protein [Thiococcus pfennigii]